MKNTKINCLKDLNMQTIADITLQDLMGQDHEVWLQRNKNHGFDLTIEGGDEDGVAIETTGIHPFAIESFADFCRQYLRCFDRLEQESCNA